MARFRHPKSRSSIVHRAFTSRSLAFTLAKRINDPSKARHFLDLSLSEIGAEVARLTGRPSAYAKSTVVKWERAGQVEPDVRRAYGTLIANRLTALTGRTIGITIEANSPWRVQAWARCDCGAWYPMQRANQKRCDKCR